ncbi:MAG: nucleotidyltransferase domain-containing protein [Chloroflexota bacterium]
MMVSDARIKGIVESIIANFSPQKIILFGSYAYGQPNRDSDVDLLVVMPTTERPLRKAAEIAAAIEHPFPIDLLVRTPEDVTTCFERGDTFIREVLTQGLVLYEA